MSCERTYERLDYNEWFIQFITPHPQLQYDKENKNLLKYQILLSEKYNNKIYNREGILELYNFYVQQKQKECINISNAEYYYKDKIKKLIKKEKENTNSYIIELIKNTN
jgi:hypothetical protein